VPGQRVEEAIQSIVGLNAEHRANATPTSASSIA
jgi:hypothetical protein